MSFISIRDLYKVFGPDTDAALRLDRSGEAPDEIQAKTGAVVAVSNASMDVARGETFVIMGLSGSGKSTLVRMINRLIDPTAGSVTVDGDDVTAMSEHDLRQLRMNRMSMVFQRFGLFPHRTVLENAAYGLEIRGMASDERQRKAHAALEMVGLVGWNDHYPSQLSGGMQQRVGIARALATDADILLMDEAFSALDPLIRREMQDHLIRLQAELHKTIVFITHDLNEAVRIGDRIAVMKDGKVVQIGTAEDILTDPADDYVAAFVQDLDASIVLTARALMRPPIDVVYGGDGPHVAIRKLEAAQRNALYATDANGRLLGLVEDEAAAEAGRRGDKTVQAVISDARAVVEPDRLLVDLLPLAADTEMPIAVVEASKLIGVVPRAALLEALSREETV